ncbi:hypothetical protein Lal_00012213 [Lupinus albus]|nr:hypothetical protein Lal_00012213 [Lupinus albus]
MRDFHNPLLFYANNDNIRRISQFSFHIMWLNHSDCSRVVADSWRNLVYGCPMFILSQKLKNLKLVLMDWNRNIFGDIHPRVQNALANVDQIQNQISVAGPSSQLLDDEEDAMTKINQVSKSLALLKEGDHFLTNNDEILSHVLNYFTNIFASSNIISNNGLVQSVIPKLVFADDNLMLSSILSDVEIKSAVFAMNGEGAPGSDGFGGCFYQHFWDVVHIDVCNSVRQFFTQGWLLANLNSNKVILITKFYGVDSIEDFRPIVMANFQFKIITKVIADRLALVAPNIVSCHQRCFIKEKQILDCLCSTSEAINLLGHKTCGGNLAIKIDIKKAFDTMDWSFILDTLNFNETFQNWIRVIMHSVKLYIIVNDVLSRGISKLLSEGKISSIIGPKHLKTVSHALFDDDILKFCKSIKREFLCITTLLQDYALASGQHINIAKSKFYTTNASARKISNISPYMGFSAGNLPFNYLGVPIFKGKPKITKLIKWKGYVLSVMGRVELVKSIIHIMAIYSFYVYSCPSQLIKHMDKCIRNFTWAGDIGVRKITTLAWHKVSLPLKNGGLGLRSLQQLKKVAMLKLSWEMMASPRDWAVFCRQRFGKSSFPSKRHFKSSIWSGIKPNWFKALKNSLFLVGNGHDINFWTDNWLGDPLDEIHQITETLHNSLLATVADFYGGSNWLILNYCLTNVPSLVLGFLKFILQLIETCSFGLEQMMSLIIVLTPFVLCLAGAKSSGLILFHLQNISQRGGLFIVEYPLMKTLCNVLCLACVIIWQWLSYIFGIPLNSNSIEILLKSCQMHWSSQSKEVIAASIIHSVNIIWFCINQLRFIGILINSAMAICKIKLNINMSALDWIKINTDGAVHGALGLFDGGGIFRDNGDDLIGCYLASFGIQNAIFAELYTAILAIGLVFYKGWKVMDTLPFLVEEHDLSSFSYIYREGNNCVDKLANY